MRSKNLALLITALFILITFAIVVAHTLEEGVAIVCLVSLAFILFYGLLSSMHELIKLIKDEE
jgi:hypothetical protein